MQLTTNWQTVKYYEFAPGTGFRAIFYLDAKYSVQSKENNTTTVQTRLTCDVTQGSGGGNGYRFALSYANTIEGGSYWSFEDETILSGESTIQHNVDGSKSITLSASMRVNYTGLDATISETVDLPTIDRYPLIVTAPDFSDEDNPIITYTTALGFSGATVEVGIFDSTGATNYVAYRQVSVSDGSYTFNLTTNERNALRNATPNSNTMQVMFKLKTTTTDSVEYVSSSIKTMSIVNAYPTNAHSEVETNQKVIDLIGSSATSIIKNASILQATITPTALKGATISSVNVSSTGFSETKTSSPYVFTIPMKASSYGIITTDSRGNPRADLVTKTIIDYLPVDITSFSFKRVNPTSSNILVSMEATYYQQTFNNIANVPIVKWKLDNGNWTTIPSSAYTIDNVNYKLTITNYQLTNVLNYRNRGQFYLSVEDKLTNDTEGGANGFVTQGIPTFDAGEHDLKVNGHLYIADEDGQNPVEVGQGGDTLPINAIVEYDGYTVPDGYEVVSNPDYSTSETKTGAFWIDNKPIYRRVFTGSSISDINTGLTTIDNVVKMEMLIRENGSAKAWRNIPWVFNNLSTSWMGGFFFKADDGTIIFQIGNDLANIDRYIIIMEYTKTTD